jgi:hypothetical protein
VWQLVTSTRRIATPPVAGFDTINVEAGECCLHGGMCAGIWLLLA